MLYKDAGHIVEYVGQGCKTGLSGGLLLYAPFFDGQLEALAELADRVFCFYDMHGDGLSQRRGIPEEIASQTTWEAFS